MERMTAENIFFHSQCFKCDHCGVKLRTTNYSVDKTSYGDGKFNLCMLGNFACFFVSSADFFFQNQLY